MLRISAILAAAMPFCAAANESFCDEIKRYLAAAQHSFTPIQGKDNTRDGAKEIKVWEVKPKPTAFLSCAVYVYEKDSYKSNMECEAVAFKIIKEPIRFSESASQSMAMRAQDLAARIGACQGLSGKTDGADWALWSDDFMSQTWTWSWPSTPNFPYAIKITLEADWPKPNITIKDEREQTLRLRIQRLTPSATRP